MIKLSSLTFFPVQWAPACAGCPAYSHSFSFTSRPPPEGGKPRRAGPETHKGAGARTNCPSKLSKNPAAQLQQATLTRPTILQHPAALSTPRKTTAPPGPLQARPAKRPARLEPLIMGLQDTRVNTFLKIISPTGKFNARVHGLPSKAVAMQGKPCTPCVTSISALALRVCQF